MIFKIFLLTLFINITVLYADDGDIDLEELPSDIQEELSVEQQEDDNDEFLEVIRGSSLLHPMDQLKDLDRILDALKSGLPINQQEIIVTDKKQEKKSESSNVSGISFYLNSILYTSDNYWTIWINGNRITRNSNNTDLTILKVAEKYIKCRWVTGYGKFVNLLIDYKERGVLPKFTTVEVTDNIATVEFLLKPNQSFKMSNSVTVSEGR